MKYELMIQNENTLYYPPILDGITVEWERRGTAGKLSFETVKTDGFNFEEGDACRFCVDGTPVFYGFVFDKSRSGRTPEIIKVTVYDQLYYLKNKDTYVYENKTASDVIRMIAEDFGLNLGELEDTLYKIPSRVEDNEELFGVIQNALDETMKVTGSLYVLYDDAGKLRLSAMENMKLGLVIDENTAGDFDYKSSIADKTYNRIKLICEDDKTGKRDVYISQDSSTIARWGVLQYYEKLSDPDGAAAMADALLGLYNSKTRTLKLTDVFGDIRVRGGSLIPVILDLGDMSVSNYLMAEQVKHTFKDGCHLMDLKVRGNTFVT